jgi:hypothetical protein
MDVVTIKVAKEEMDNKRACTYDKSKCYINCKVNNKSWHRKEWVVSKFKFYLIWIVSFGRFRKYKQFNVLYEKD